MTAQPAPAAPTFKKTSFGVLTSDDCQDGMSMLKEAKGDFTVEKMPISYQVPVETETDTGEIFTDYEYRPMNIFAPVRTDTLEHVAEASVGDGFVIVQNQEVIDIIDAICKDHDLQYRYMTVASGGAGLITQVYSEDLNKSLSIGNDKMEGLLTISNFHDGSGALKVHVSMLRLFCENVLPALGREFREGKRKKQWHIHSIKHSRHIERRINDMVRCYRDAMGDLEETANTLRLLANKKCTVNEMDNLFWEIVNADGKSQDELTDRARTQRTKKYEAIKALRNDPRNKVEDAPGTWYEALQPITAYATRDIRTRDTGRVSSSESRFMSAYFGAGSDLAATGLRKAVELSGV